MKKVTIGLLLLLLAAAPFDLFPQKTTRPGGALRQKGILPQSVLNLNLVGVGMYGPMVQMEFKITGSGYVSPWVRYSYAGVISQYEWTNFEDDSKLYPSAIAVGLGYKEYLQVSKRKQSVYYGGFGEFIHEKGLHNMDSDYEYAQTRLAVAVYGNLGYRWQFKRSFLLSLGILPGFAFDLKNEGLYNTGASEGLPYGDYKENRFVGMIDLTFGWITGR
jgi:hypothetical protein